MQNSATTAGLGTSTNSSEKLTCQNFQKHHSTVQLSFQMSFLFKNHKFSVINGQFLYTKNSEIVLLACD